MTTIVEVFLRGRLLARYDGDEEIAAMPQAEGDLALASLAKQALLRDRLVDEPHLDDLNFEVRRP